MKVKNINIDTDVFLAPLAGYTDLPYRIIVEKMGCKFTFTEMINAKALTRQDEKTLAMLDTTGQKNKVGVQIFGRDPETMSKATEILTKMNRFALIDINMGCPVPKVVRNGEGSALMREPELIYDIVTRVIQSTDLPVSCKIRKGFDSKHINAVEIAKIIEKAGASLITVHGRTREDYFKTSVDLDIIKSVKENVNIPVIGNGSIFSLKDKEHMIEYTNCDAVMIGRGAIGNPFIFSYINGRDVHITNQDKINILIEHYRLSLDIIGEDSVLTMRKHMNSYLKGMKNSTKIKNYLNTVKDSEEVIKTLEDYSKTLTNI